jgi:hypothetical protein
MSLTYDDLLAAARSHSNPRALITKLLLVAHPGTIPKARERLAETFERSPLPPYFGIEIEARESAFAPADMAYIEAKNRCGETMQSFILDLREKTEPPG